MCVCVCVYCNANHIFSIKYPVQADMSPSGISPGKTGKIMSLGWLGNQTSVSSFPSSNHFLNTKFGCFFFCFFLILSPEVSLLQSYSPLTSVFINLADFFCWVTWLSIADGFSFSVFFLLSSHTSKFCVIKAAIAQLTTARNLFHTVTHPSPPQ